MGAVLKSIVLLLGTVILLEAQEPSPVLLNAQALEAYYQAHYQDAEKLYRESLAGWDRLRPDFARDRITTQANLGTLLRTEGRYAEAENLLLDCMREAQAGGAQSVETGRAASGLAALYLAWGKLPVAESYARRADKIFAHSEDVAVDQRNNWKLLGSLYLAKGSYAEAETLMNRVLASDDEHLAAGVYNELATAALRQNRLDKAETLALQALEMARHTLPEGHSLRPVIWNNLAQVYRREGRYVEAERSYRSAIESSQASLGAHHPDAAKVMLNLASLYHERGRQAEADELYGQAASVLEAVYGPNDALVLVARNEWADVLRSEGKLAEAEPMEHASLMALEMTLEPQDPRVLHAMDNYARLLNSLKRPKEAAALRAQIRLAQGFRKSDAAN